jgi:hypothetical protein
MVWARRPVAACAASAAGFRRIAGTVAIAAAAAVAHREVSRVEPTAAMCLAGNSRKSMQRRGGCSCPATLLPRRHTDVAGTPAQVCRARLSAPDFT